jgi:hypothetical protein
MSMLFLFVRFVQLTLTSAGTEDANSIKLQDSQLMTLSTQVAQHSYPNGRHEYAHHLSTDISNKIQATE